jgi:general nucleoside transport system permease protein
MIFNQFLFHSAISSITPLLLAALGGMLCERVAVFNIALEGKMLSGAFAAVVVSWFTGSPLLGALGAMIVGMLISTIFIFGVVRLRGDPIVISIGINLLAVGLTSFLLRQIFNVEGAFSDPSLQGYATLSIPGLKSIPYVGPIFDQHTLVTYASWILLVAIWFFLSKTTLGLRLRGVGIEPAAATALGVRVRTYQSAAILVAGALCGLAGSQLSLGSVSLFASEMSAGRGWIAVVAVMLGRAQPLGVFMACVAFGLADSLGLRLQGLGLPTQLTEACPYLITLVALLLSAKFRSNASSARA